MSNWFSVFSLASDIISLNGWLSNGYSKSKLHNWTATDQSQVNLNNEIENGRLNLRLSVDVGTFANVKDVVHRQAAVMVRRAPESLVEQAVSVLMSIFSNKPLVSHTSTTHHQSAAIPLICGNENWTKIRQIGVLVW